MAMASRATLLAKAAAGTMLAATDRWKTGWDKVFAGKAQDLPRLTGFTAHAVELWWLTRTIVRVSQSGDQSCRFAQPVPTDSIKDLHDFIRMHKDW